jgi:uncharacterized protein
VINGHRVTDFHVHVQPWHEMKPAARAVIDHGETGARMRRFLEDPGALVTQLDDWGIDRAVLINYVAPDTMGFTEAVNDWISRYTKDHRERLIPAGSVHPRRLDGQGAAYRAVGRLVNELGIRVLKLHPAHQLVWPDAYRMDSRGAHGHPPDDSRYSEELSGIYAGCVDHGAVLMVHTGTSLFPGAVNMMADPMILDAVAVDHPRLPIVMAHAGRPLWGEAACFVARRHPNVYLDVSGIPPHALLRYVPDLPRLAAAGKVLWGTDWPGPGVPAEAPRVNVEAFLAADLGLTDVEKGLVLDGASRVLLP